MALPEPDHSTCVYCRLPITWDDYSYVHDSNGFADCGITLVGGRRVSLRSESAQGSSIVRLQIDPTILKEPALVDKRARPVEWGPE